MICETRPIGFDPKAATLQPNLLKVSGDGAFFTVQGEGESIGKPAVFLRLQLCNLRCGWCDTRHTWDKTLPEFWSESVDWSIEKAVAEISVFGQRRLVITGGEPMMQQAMISRLISRIPEWDIELETNGTIPPNEELAERCQFNVSPKLANSGNLERVRLRPKVLQKFNALPKATFKFVVQSVGDIREIDAIVAGCNLDPDKIIIMPEGRSEEEIREHALNVIDEVKARGWRMLPRLQVTLCGDKRGV